ncbi:MAG: hypothetical protein HQM03_10285 [Magnetococcales bacterium]|nr:hypothetical protein [Magnetococcales bacterium]
MEVTAELTLESLHQALSVIRQDYLGLRVVENGNERVGDSLLLRAFFSLNYVYGLEIEDLIPDQVPFEINNIHHMICEMKDVIINNEYTIIMRTGQNMACYAREYDVRVDKNIDIMKLAYWYGQAVTELFTGLKGDIAKIALLILMDQFVYRYSKGRKINSQIWSKLAHTMIQDRDRDNLGRYGIYMIFKNSALVCNDDCEHGIKSFYRSLP